MKNFEQTKPARKRTKPIEITKTLLDGLSIPEGEDRVYIRDSRTPGFGAVKHESGKVSFIFERRIDGKPVRKVIGPYGTWTVQTAREEAQKLSRQVDTGIDPFEKRERLKAEPTLGEFGTTYLERHARPHKRSAHKDEYHLGRYFDLFRTKKLSRITRDEVARWHLSVGENHGKYVANRLLELMRKMFNLAVDWGTLPEGHPNPATRIKRFAEEKRDRFLSPEEIEKFFEAVREEPNPVWRAFFLMLIFTGVRKNELLSARWEDFDLTAKTWRIPQTKSGKPHVLPLTAPVLNLLGELPRRKESVWLFPSYGQSGHREEPIKPWNRIREKAGIKDVRIHDLRRTLGSWMAMSGFTLNLIGRVLNHSQVSTTAVYARLGNDPQREALETVQAKMLETVSGR